MTTTRKTRAKPPPPTPPPSPERAELDRALAGYRPPCADATWHTSDVRHLRDRAITMCRTCAVLDPCRAVAEVEQPTHGVWAGSDWTTSTGAASRPTTTDPGDPR